MPQSVKTAHTVLVLADALLTPLAAICGTSNQEELYDMGKTCCQRHALWL
jgi:hypothetical protein